MILNTLLILAALFCAGAALLILAPVSATVDFSFKDLRPNGSGGFSFLHPLLLAAQIDFATRRISVRILGRSFGAKCRQDQEGAPPADADRPNGMQLHGENAPFDEGDVFAAPLPFTPRPDEETRQVPFQPGDDTAVQRHVAPVPEPSLSSPRGGRVSAIPASDAGAVPDEPMAPEKEKKDNWYKQLQRNRYLFFLRNSAWRNKILRWTARVVRTLFGIVKFERFRLSIRAGVEDPMVMGIIAGVYQAAAYGLTIKEPYLISFEPVFMTDCIECCGGLRISTSLWRLCFPVVVAIATFPALHTLWLVWRSRQMQQKRKGPASG